MEFSQSVIFFDKDLDAETQDMIGLENQQRKRKGK